jgi:hypothetical protein
MLFLTYVTERFVRILNTFSYEAAVDVLGALCGVVTILENEYELALTYHSYGQSCYLYADLVMRLFLAIESFCSTKLSQPRKTPKYIRKKPVQVDANISVFVECSIRLKGINKKWLDWEEMIRTDTLGLLTQESECESYRHKLDDCFEEVIIFLSESMSSHATNALLSQEDVRSTHKSIHSALLDAFRYVWPDDKYLRLHTFGSHATMLGDGESDLDMTLLRANTVNPVEDLEKVAAAAESIGFEIVNFMRGARVPVLKLLDKRTDIEVDIVMNNNLALRNSKLLRDYSTVDDRVHPLVLAVKHWAKQRGCRDPRNATLTSYAWTLMVIYYLVCHPTDPAPSLRELPDRLREKKAESKRRLMRGENSKYEPPAPKPNIGRLLVEFFAYYGTSSPSGFQPFHSILSLRNESAIYKTSSHLHEPNEYLVTAEEALQIANGNSALDTARSEETESRKASSSNDLTALITDEAVKKSGVTVAKSNPPSWRFCIEDPFEEYDLGRVIYCKTGQIHIMNELKRAITLFYDVVVKYRLMKQQQDDCDTSASPEETCDYWLLLCEQNTNVPVAIKTCPVCGQTGHFSKDCDLNRCHLCTEKGHSMKDCIMLFCSNCSQQGHFAKDCKKERICRFCKEVGHMIKYCPRRACTKCGSVKHKTKYCMADRADAKSVPGTETSIAEHKANVMSALHAHKVHNKHIKKARKRVPKKLRAESSESVDTPNTVKPGQMPGQSQSHNPTQGQGQGQGQRVGSRPEIIQNLPFLRVQYERADSMSSVGSSPVDEEIVPPKRRNKHPKPSDGVGLSARIASAIQSKPSSRDINIDVSPYRDSTISNEMKLGVNEKSGIPLDMQPAPGKSPRKSSPTDIKFAASKVVNYDFDGSEVQNTGVMSSLVGAQSKAESKIASPQPISFDNDPPFETVLDIVPTVQSPSLQAKRDAKRDLSTPLSPPLLVVVPRTRSFGEKKGPATDAPEDEISAPQITSEDKYVPPSRDNADMYLSDEKSSALPAELGSSPLGQSSKKSSKRGQGLVRKTKRPTTVRDVQGRLGQLDADAKGPVEVSSSSHGVSSIKRQVGDSKYSRDKKASGASAETAESAATLFTTTPHEPEWQPPVNGFFL